MTMIKSRKEILSINPAFTKFILDLQLSFKPESYEEGEKILFDLDDDEATVLTKQLTDKLNEEQEKEFEENRDINPFEDSVSLEFIETRLIISSNKNSLDYLQNIASLLEIMRAKLGESELMILGVENTPWLAQENDYLPVRNALDYLGKKIDKDFAGGFLLKEDAIIEFIPHLFWLIRCNAGLTYFYFSFPNSKTMISLCKYGVLHFEFYDQEEKLKILKTLSSLNFKEVDECNDPIEFDKFDGRQMIF